MHSWQPLSLITSDVAARPPGLWTLVADFVEGPALLRITARPEDSWSYSDIQSATCGPDGDPRALIATTRCLVPTAPVGALVGKIGGSSAATDDGKSFAVGHNCVVRVPDDGGPLYLSINDEPAGMDNNAQVMSVTILIAAVAQPTKTDAFTSEVHPGETYLGTVTRLTDSGAYLTILDGKEGFVHISQLAPYEVKNVENVVNPGDQIMVRVIEIDSKGHINLSRSDLGSPASDSTSLSVDAPEPSAPSE